MPSTEVHDRHDKRHVEMFEGFVAALPNPKPLLRQHSDRSTGRKLSLHGEELPPAHRKHGAEMRRSSIRCGQVLGVWGLGIEAKL